MRSPGRTSGACRRYAWKGAVQSASVVTAVQTMKVKLQVRRLLGAQAVRKRLTAKNTAAKFADEEDYGHNGSEGDGESEAARKEGDRIFCHNTAVQWTVR